MRFLRFANHKNALLYALGALLLFVLAVRLISLDFYPLMSTTEARYAEMSRKILELNEWIVLYYYDYDTPFWGKPPLSFWASSVTMWLFGVNEFGARFAPFVFGLLCCGLFFLWQFRREVGESRALRPIACAVILSTTGLGFVAMGAVMTDEALLFCVMLCMISFWRCVVSNSSLAQSSRELEKFSLDRQQVLSHSNFSAQPTNLTQDTRIANDSRNLSLRGSGEATTKQSKSSDLKKQGESMSQKRINANSLQISDSSNSQIHPNVDCHDLTASSLAMTENITDSKSRKIFGYLFFIGLGLGLLAKGPLIFVLVGLPIVAFIIALHFFAPKAQRARILHLKNLPFISGTILMLLIALPWYIAFEVKSAGFLEYFILGEHFKRFFVSGWEGSLYGAAHSQPIGTIWWFFFVSFLPWSVVFLGFVAKKIYGFFKIRGDFATRIALSKNPANIENLYLALWILMPLCFLTFSRNILEAYTLPCAPAFCILMANFIFGEGGGSLGVESGFCHSR